MRLMKALGCSVCALGVSFSSFVLGTGGYVSNDEVTGSNGRVVTGIGYRIKTAHGTVLDDDGGNTNSTVFMQSDVYNQYDAHRVWALIDVNGGYRIKTKTTRRVLDDRGGSVGATVFPQDDVYNQYDACRTWTLVAVNGGFRIKSRHGTVLDDAGGGVGARVFMQSDVYNQYDACRAWQFVPMNYQVTGVVTNMQYGDIQRLLDGSTRKMEDATSSCYSNDGSQFQDYHFSATKYIEKELSLSFEQSEEVNFSNKFEVRVEVPWFGWLGALLGVSGHAQNNFDWDRHTRFSEKKFERKFEADSFRYDSTVKVPPHRETRLTCLYEMVDLKVPFTADVRFSAVADRLRSDGSFDVRQNVDSAAVMSFLLHDGYRGSIYRRDANYVYARVNGTLSIGRGRNLEFKLREMPL